MGPQQRGRPSNVALELTERHPFRNPVDVAIGYIVNGGIARVPCFDRKGNTVREVVDPQPPLKRHALDFLDVRQRTQRPAEQRRIRGFR